MNVIAAGKRAVLRDALPSDAAAYVQWWTRGEWLSYDAPWQAGPKTFESDEAVQAFKQGFAKQLLARGVSQLASMGADHVTSDTSPRNKASRATHEKAGFALAATEGEDFLGRWRSDCCFYRWQGGGSPAHLPTIRTGRG